MVELDHLCGRQIEGSPQPLQLVLRSEQKLIAVAGVVQDAACATVVGECAALVDKGREAAWASRRRLASCSR